MNAIKIFNDLKADELFLLDIEATKQNKMIDPRIVKELGEEARMPFAVGGGLKSLEDILTVLNAGAERVVINTQAGLQPSFIEAAAREFGSSTIVVCIDVKKTFWNKEKVWIRSATKSLDYSPVAFAQLLEKSGAGEIVIQSIEQDGRMNGYDLGLTRKVASAITIPTVALGGAGSLEQLMEGHTKGYASGLAAGSLFVYEGKERGVLINYPQQLHLNHQSS
jgi:cyclase